MKKSDTVGDKDKADTSQVPTKMGGQKGAVAFIIFYLVYTYYLAIKDQTGDWDLLSVKLEVMEWPSLLHVKLALGLLAWLAVQALLYMMPWGGRLQSGVTLESGLSLKYRTNGLFVLLLNIAGFLFVHAFFYDVTSINSYLVQLVTSYLLLSVPFSVLLYRMGRYSDRARLNPHGNTGYKFYDWFMGRDLNPRLGHLDIKYVMIRSCVIAYMLLNIGTGLEYYNRYGTMNANLLALSGVQFWYILDIFYNERGLIVSREVVSEGLGANMLLQVALIPVCYVIQTRFVSTTDYTCHPGLLGVFVAVFGLGNYIYRRSNAEKNLFRENPNDPRVAHLKTMKTSRGKSLLVSGWWGMCRHPNYLGDIIMSLSFALFTGAGYVVPYFNAAFLLMLLLDRLEQDNEDCQRKYGDDWQKYCAIVKYKMVPGLY